MNTITRRQIKSKGATQYLSNKVTQGLGPVGKEGGSFTYKVVEVLKVVKDLIVHPKTRKSTIASLQLIEQWLSSIESKVIAFPEGRATLSEQLRRTRKAVADLRTDILKASK
jgi:hypothetical protein